MSRKMITCNYHQDRPAHSVYKLHVPEPNEDRAQYERNTEQAHGYNVFLCRECSCQQIREAGTDGKQRIMRYVPVQTIGSIERQDEAGIRDWQFMYIHEGEILLAHPWGHGYEVRAMSAEEMRLR